MAIRDRLRAKFGKSKSTSPTGSTTTSSINGEEYYTGRKDIEYYKPHEIPKSKYGRGRIDPEHKEKLDAYSFGDAFATMKRKTSMAFSGTFSPGGTKALSAANSAAASRRASYMSVTSSFSGSGASPTYDSDGMSSSSHGSGEYGEYDENDLSRIGTVREDNGDHFMDRQATVTEKNPGLGHRKTLSNEQPFTIEELERAMSKATMRNSGERMLRQPIAA